MRKSTLLLMCGALIAAVLALPTTASSALQYWDVNGSTAGLGGTGTWDVGTTPNWNNSAGTGAPQTWTNGNDANFQGTGGTVTFSGAIAAGTMTMATVPFTFNPAAGPGNTLTFTQLTVPTTSGVQTTFGGGITGADLTLVDNNGAIPNNVAIGGVNTFTGNVNLNGTGAGTSSASRLAFLINTIGAVPTTADFNYRRNFSQVNFNVIGNHGTVPHDFNINPDNFVPPSGPFEGWIGALNGATVNLSGLISGNGGLTFGLGASGGAGVITLSNNNTYTGATRWVNALTGVIKLGVNNALPTTTGLSFGTGSTNCGSLDLNGMNQTVASLASATTGNQNGIVNTQGATTTSTLTINGSATTSYNGPLGSAGDPTNLPNVADHHKIQLVLDAANTGKLTLSRATGMAYSGGTTINGGTLLVANTSGSGTGSGAVAVNSGGKLGGTGIISGPVTVADGGTLAPGASPGTLTINNSVALNPMSDMAFELAGNNTTVGGGVNDLITGVTHLTLDGTLNVSETVAGSFLSAGAGDKWRLMNYSGVLTNNTLDVGTMPALSAGLFFTIETSMANQVNLLVSAIPEPAAFLCVLVVGVLVVMHKKVLAPLVNRFPSG